jgi:hypothetical protein
MTNTSLPRISPWKFLEREGIPLSEYRWGQLLPTLPFTALMHGFFKVIGWTCYETSAPNVDIPSNAIIYLLHGDSYISFVTQRFWRRVYDQKMSWMGFHGVLSYLGSSWCYLMGVRCFRYDRRSPLRPLNQAIEFLRHEARGQFAIRTDAGGPYGKVRASLVDMSLATDRPLVAIRQRSSRALTIRQHHVPLPFSRVTTAISAPIYPDELRGRAREDARQRLQAAIDGL